MKTFDKFSLNTQTLESELIKFKKLLNQEKLDEFKDILPFFKKHKHLSAFIGTYHPNLIKPDKIAYEYDIFGDFSADLVVGDSLTNSYCFIEFENADHNSIFSQAGNRNTRKWSPRLENGFSQIIDWFYKLDNQKTTIDFENRFQTRNINYIGLLIIGRNNSILPEEKYRFEWRQDNVIVNSKPIMIITFDDLYETLYLRFQAYYS
jgi:hypothetical protein